MHARPPRVEKTGDAAALGREAAALALVAGRPWAPRLIEAAPGRLVTAPVAGGPRPGAAVGEADAGRLGAVLREVHETRRAPAGGMWWRALPDRSLAQYRAGRVADAEARLAGTAWAGVARAAAAAIPGRRPGRDGAPFRLLHGDLVAPNLLWPPDGPVLIDWEFWRMGDPAEDLAYLAEVGGLPAASAATAVEAYGVPGMARRVDRWRGLVCADAGGWYLREGMAAEAAPLLARARSHASGASSAPG